MERCSVLLHLIDGTSGDPVGDYKTIIKELEAYGGHLGDKPRVTVLNKIDTLDEEERAFLVEEIKAGTGVDVMLMAGATGEGTVDVLRALKGEIADDKLRQKKATQEAEGEAEAWRP